MVSHIHDLTYILKTDGEGHYMGRMREIPAVMAYGVSQKDVEIKLPEATLSYFKAFSDVHDQMLCKSPEAKISESDWAKGKILGTKPIKVQC